MKVLNIAKEQKKESPRNLRLPKRDEGEMFAIVKKMHGTDQVTAMCEDGEKRMCRIPGKMKKRIWIREGDLIIVKIWSFQPSKADIAWRYLGGQKNLLKRKGYLDKLDL